MQMNCEKIGGQALCMQKSARVHIDNWNQIRDNI